VLRESDHRGQQTALTPLLLSTFGIAQAQGLLHEVYYSNLPAVRVGSLACVEARSGKATVRRSASFERGERGSKRLV
jgi:hypothetical protein